MVHVVVLKLPGLEALVFSVGHEDRCFTFTYDDIGVHEHLLVASEVGWRLIVDNRLVVCSLAHEGSSARDTLVADYDESSEPNLREGSPDAPGNRSATLSILPHCPHIGPVSSQLLAQATYE